MADEENEHRRDLLNLFQSKFGEHIPLVRRQDVRGFLTRKPIWQTAARQRRSGAGLDAVHGNGDRRFYTRAAARSQDASIRKLLGDLAVAENVP